MYVSFHLARRILLENIEIIGTISAPFSEACVSTHVAINMTIDLIANDNFVKEYILLYIYTFACTLKRKATAVFYYFY